MVKFTDEIEAVIVELKGSGFWRESTEARLRSTIEMLVRHGLANAAIALAIKEFWETTSAEYGE